ARARSLAVDTARRARRLPGTRPVHARLWWSGPSMAHGDGERGSDNVAPILSTRAAIRGRRGARAVEQVSIGSVRAPPTTPWNQRLHSTQHITTRRGRPAPAPRGAPPASRDQISR